jgi:transcriptional regulator GlxA family with amidase domain
MEPRPKKIGILGYPDVTALDVVGPAEAFATANSATTDLPAARRYEVIIIGATGKEFLSESGLVMRAHVSLKATPPLDTLIIPGGRGLRLGHLGDTVATWIESRAKRTRRVVSVCTGVYGLAECGVLDGRRVTTHWKYADDLTRRFPKLNVDSNAIFLKDGPFYTSAGITAGIDLSLALIEEDFGQSLALAVARELVVYLKRPGGQEQYSEPLRFQSKSTDRFEDLAGWMVAHLDSDLTVDALAKRACVGTRHFSRLFKETFGTTPAAFVERIRLDEARQRLAESSASITQVALSVGFHSDDVFRRAFERRFGVVPGEYRGRFETAANGV